MIICVCKAVNDTALNEAIDDGACDIDSIRRRTNACTQCRKCKPSIESLIIKRTGFTVKPREATDSVMFKSRTSESDIIARL